MADLPSPIIDHVEVALRNIAQGANYSEFGWQE